MKLETERLILRKPKESDWEDLIDMANNKKFSKYLSGVPYPFTKKDARDLIKKRSKTSKDDYYFAIVLKSNKKVIGTIHLHIDAPHKKGITASWINRKYWRKGYITEAKTAIIDFAFEKLNLRKLGSEVFVENKYSINLQKKLGYRLEGKLRQDRKSKATGKIHDLNVYGLLKSEWKKSRPKVVKKLNEKIKNLKNK